MGIQCKVYSLIKSSEKRILIIPPSLGYGEDGTMDGGSPIFIISESLVIPPNAVLFFEVELVDINGFKESQRN